jgi:lycopene cyclase domain-containing protein
VERAQVSFLYLLGLLAAIGGLALLDFRHKLAFAKNAKHIYPILISVVFFLIWDYAGISLGIFFRGESKLLSGLLLSNELPLEELFFLILLSYNALLLLQFFTRRSHRREDSAGKK